MDWFEHPGVVVCLRDAGIEDKACPAVSARGLVALLTCLQTRGGMGGVWESWEKFAGGAVSSTNEGWSLILSKFTLGTARESSFGAVVLWTVVVVLGGFCLQFRGVACNLCNAAFVCLYCKLMSGEWHEAEALDQQVCDISVAMSFYSKQVSWRSFIPGFLSSLAFVSLC